MTNLKNISDNELFIRCKKYGKEALKARQIFGGLLPEVCKRRLYEKKGFDSIYTFAAKLAGFTHDQVDTYIRLERKFEDKPALHAALVEGKISANKLIRIASIATTENQSELFNVAQKLSKAAIDVYVKDYKHARSEAECAINKSFAHAKHQPHIGSGDENKKQNGLFVPENAPKTLPVQTFVCEKAAGQNSAAAATPNIDFEIIAALSPELKMKMKALIDKGINVSELFTGFLEQHEQTIARKKEEIAQDLESKSENSKRNMPQIQPVTRHIPSAVKRIIKQEFGTKCANQNCKKPAENLHHQKHFAIFKTHNSRFIEPLCKGHHELKHSSEPSYRRYKFVAAL